MPIARKCARGAGARSGAGGEGSVPGTPVAARPGSRPREYASRRLQRPPRPSLDRAINGAILGARADDAPFEVVAVGSRTPSRAQAYAHEHGIARAHGSYDALLADPSVDAVYIALPNALHHEWTMRALAAGKHVLCEKPYTRHPDEVDEAWDEAERRGLVLTEGVHVAARARRRRCSASCCRGWASCARSTRPSRRARRAPTTCAGCASSAAARCSTSAATASAPRGSCSGEPDECVTARRSCGARSTSISPGLLRFGDVAATFQCGFTRALVNRIEVVGAAGVLEVPQAFVEPPGVVLLDGEEHRVERGRPLPRRARRLLRRDPRRAARPDRPRGDARPGRNARRAAGRC